MHDKQLANFLQTQWEGPIFGGVLSNAPQIGTSKLSDILETVPSQKYALSPQACKGILRRAKKRGKTLPEPLMHALQQVADLAPTLSVKEDCK